MNQTDNWCEKNRKIDLKHRNDFQQQQQKSFFDFGSSRKLEINGLRACVTSLLSLQNKVKLINPQISRKISTKKVQNVSSYDWLTLLKDLQETETELHQSLDRLK